VLAPAVDFFPVERRQSLLADGIGHVAYVGVAAALALGIGIGLLSSLTGLVIATTATCREAARSSSSPRGVRALRGRRSAPALTRSTEARRFCRYRAAVQQGEGVRVGKPRRQRRWSGRRAGTLAVTVLCLGYLVWKLDLGTTLDVLSQADARLVLLALAFLVLAVPPLAWRWQLLLRARGVHDELGWLTKEYYVSYTAGQVLPTSLGGDAFRIVDTGRRHADRRGAVAATVLLERGLGGMATLALGALGFVLALGRYDIGAYLWLELGLAVAAVFLGVAFFSRSARRVLRHAPRVLRGLRLERPVRVFYEEVHAFRARPLLLASLFALTLGVQACRVLTMWIVGRAAGVELSPLPYYVMGPLLFLVMLFPLTLNGFALREAFFVSFLGQLGVAPDAAFATGFLYFLVSLGLALPGAAVLLWQALQPHRVASARAAAGRRSSD
jgi:uncharacterized protein (TIRG00374 family)